MPATLVTGSPDLKFFRSNFVKPQQHNFLVVKVSCASESSSTSVTSTTTPTRLPNDGTIKKKVVRDIPGTFGFPILGPWKDRQEFLYGSSGNAAFFEKRIEEHGSTVLRTNMPPGSPFFPSSKVVALLDQVSFATLFDTSKVSKRDVFTGTYMPSTGYTGGYRVLSYLDVDEPKHAQLKNFCADLIRSNARKWLPELHSACSVAFDEWDDKEQPLKSLVDVACLDFLCMSVLDRKPEITPKDLQLWILPQIVPVAGGFLPGPMLLEDLLLHTFPIPPFLVRKFQDKIVDFFGKGERALDLAASHGVQRDEAVHNIIFFLCFNTWGGFIRLLPSIVQYIAADPELQAELRTEIRASSSVTMRSLDENMPLLKSTIYEVLRVCPPVAHQYGRAKKDLIVESHDEAFHVRKGEMLYGYQPLVTRDPRVFKDDPNEFRPKRFMSAQAQEQLLPHLLWSNGPETAKPSPGNKQCPGKDFVILIARAFVAELFLRYDSLQLIPARQSVRFHKRSS